jgi:hypothetical protein
MLEIEITKSLRDITLYQRVNISWLLKGMYFFQNTGNQLPTKRHVTDNLNLQKHHWENLISRRNSILGKELDPFFPPPLPVHSGIQYNSYVELSFEIISQYLL